MCIMMIINIYIYTIFFMSIYGILEFLNLLKVCSLSEITNPYCIVNKTMIN